MTWTYNSSASALDQVRRYTGDDDSSDQLFSDEAINAELSLRGNDPVQASIYLLNGLAAKYSRKAIQKSAGKYSEDLRQRASDLRAQAKHLQEMGASEPCSEVAEQTFGDPKHPWDGSQEQDLEARDDLRNGC